MGGVRAAVLVAGWGRVERGWALGSCSPGAAAGHAGLSCCFGGVNSGFG